ncbi:MAG: inorganic diphosphatase [Actinomycetota bacterium]|nr:inorganic diphosphatase [Actinomycetota bacterium]
MARHLVDDVPEPDPGVLEVVVEVPRGSRNKYEWDAEQGVVRFDRRLIGAVAFPADYGFVPETTGSDEEPLDALVLLDEPTFPGVRVRCRAVGVQWIGTRHGPEAKLLCVPIGEPAYEHVGDLDDLPPHVAREIGQFFAVYKQLDAGSTPTDEGVQGRAVALAVLREARERWAVTRRR